MARFWWVNHKQTARRMIEGGYLWSPKHNVRKADGAAINNETYNNMRRVNPGDGIISYSFKKIAYVGRATSFAFTSKRPIALAPMDTYWGESGWLLPVAWLSVKSPVFPADHIAVIGDLLPKKYSPIKPTGDGNQNVFLAEISRELFEVLCGLAHSQDVSLSNIDFSAPSPETIDDEVVIRIIQNPDLPETEKEAIVKARRGQGKFRQNVSRREFLCRVTGVSNRDLLIASHIKPWRDCGPAERLDGSNGLLLTPDVDRLFDRGFITFHDDGNAEVSSRVPLSDVYGLGLKESVEGTKRILHVAKRHDFTSAQRSYLDYHRRQVFLPPV